MFPLVIPRSSYRRVSVSNETRTQSDMQSSGKSEKKHEKLPKSPNMKLCCWVIELLVSAGLDDCICGFLSRPDDGSKLCGLPLVQHADLCDHSAFSKIELLHVFDVLASGSCNQCKSEHSDRLL